MRSSGPCSWHCEQESDRGVVCGGCHTKGFHSCKELRLILGTQGSCWRVWEWQVQICLVGRPLCLCCEKITCGKSFKSYKEMTLEEEKNQNPNQLLKESQLLKLLNVKNIYLQFREKYFQSPWLQMEHRKKRLRDLRYTLFVRNKGKRERSQPTSLHSLPRNLHPLQPPCAGQLSLRSAFRTKFAQQNKKLSMCLGKLLSCAR